MLFFFEKITINVNPSEWTKNGRSTPNCQAHIHCDNLGPIRAQIAKLLGVSRANKNVSKVCREQEIIPWENLLAKQIKPGVRHKLLGNYFNNRRWVPTNKWYNMEGPTNMSNIPSSWQPHLKKSTNKKGRVRKGGWNKN